MKTELATQKLALTELSNKLFMYTDLQQWNKVLDEVFTEQVWFDASSAGGGAPQLMRAADICEMWKQGFAGLDAVHHQAGHYIIEVKVDEADIFGYAIANHYKKAATKGNVRSFVGSYDLKAIKAAKGWRLNQFKYNLKYIDGNVNLD